MILQELAFKSVMILSQKTSIEDVAKALCEKQVGCSLLSDEKGHLVGMVTDRDIVCNALAKGISPKETVSKIMSKALIYVSETANLSEAVELMKNFGIRRLPVIRQLKSGKQRCVGLVTVDDLIIEKAISLEDLSELMANQLLPLISFEYKRLKAGTANVPNVAV